ncbi:sigma-70 family RNA polymerase sigma factor [Roseixanthobacter pseudopolyaromaticivorans]|uniref:sigma-70 family RNA polymerase sigma factor n=1 Tax=Xanthobacteraceae TaxID=335928 RepID=UPI00372B2177
MTLASREQEWAELMRAAIAGDAAAYRGFLQALTPHLRAMARRRCNSYGSPHSDAEDVVQEVLLAIHLKRGTWDQDRPIGPWLSAIVRNKMVDTLRRRGRHVDIPIEDLSDVLQADEPADATQAYDIDRILSTLKGPQRDIVRSISVDGTSVRETAGRLNMSEGAVRVALHRALRTLAAAYRGNV